MNKQEKRETPSYYAIVPSEVRYCKNLSYGARLLFGEIMALANKSGFCWASNDYFCKLYEIHQTTVTEWVASLKKEGFINFTLGKGNMRKITVMNTLRKKPLTAKPEDLRTDKENHLNNNTSINNTINTNEEVKKPLVEVFNSAQYFRGLLNSKDIVLSIIAYYTLKKGNECSISNKDQASAVISRNYKVAKRLAVFEKSKISKAIDECQNTIIGGRPMNYTLETVEKFMLK